MTILHSQTIPVVDLRDFQQGESAKRDAFVNTVGKALKEIGFFALSNHGIDEQLINESYSSADQVFKLPTSKKKRYEIPGLMGDRGYTSFGKEQAVGAPAADLKEFWHVGLERRPLPTTHNQNVWPQEVPSFKPTMCQLFTQLTDISYELLKASALYIKEPETLFSDMAIDGTHVLRAIHYPPVPEEVSPQSIRAAAHEDINLITLLIQSTASGLELLKRDGSWHPVHALEGHIIVDTGDMLQRLTNGYYRSTTHRVVNPDNSRDRRYSLPLFVHPRSEVSLASLPSCIEKTGGKKRWEDCTSGEYLKERLANITLEN
jgi:isopenicillin N synthase-like dioxygenase